MDVFIVALLIEQSFAMFASILGTWLPFAFAGRIESQLARMAV
jgi:hypothetical protein